MKSSSVSVIVPCLNEEEGISEFLDKLCAFAPDEIIVVDGGSTDGTRPILKSRSHVKLIESNIKQRAHQMNLGAREAQGDVLLFLHADTSLPENWQTEVARVMSNTSNVGGAFSLDFDGSHWILSIIKIVTKWNLPWLTFGDHAMFFRKEVFDDLGGYPEMPILEDLELQLRARRIGRMSRIKSPVRTSARRFFTNGVIKQSLIDLVILTGYYVGVSPTRLARIYYA